MNDELYDYTQYKEINCIHCGKPFKIYKRKTDNKFSEKLVCEDCSKPKQTKELICEGCGKTFITNRTKEGRFNIRRFCDECAKPPETKEVKCKWCGKPFTLYRDPTTKSFKNRVICPDCSAEMNRKEEKRICKSCGKEFILTKSKTSGQFSSGRVLCDECQKPPETKELVCKKCGKTFTTTRSKTDRKNSFLYRLYCPDCNLTDKEERELICQYCGENFKVKRYGKCRTFPDYVYCENCIGKPLKKICKTCGKEFDSIITNRYRYGYKQMDCPDCLVEKQGLPSEYELAFFSNLLDQGVDKDNIDAEYRLYYNNCQNVFYYDFLIKDQKTFIEVNPTYTHSTKINVWGNRKDRDYHLNKTKVAEAAGYRCINVWQWDDVGKIINLIKPKQKLYARNLQLKTADKYEVNNFLDKHHLQNSCYGNTVNLGLYDSNDTLIQVMAFGKPRYNKNYEWELLRLCTKSEYYVVGGAEKLFKHFVIQHKPKSVISYCDVSKFNGDVYTRLGFKLLRQTTPQKVWSRTKPEDKDYITDNLLRQQGYDRLFNANYGKGTDNEQLMLENGWLPVYDCGQKVFEWKQ